MAKDLPQADEGEFGFVLDTNARPGETRTHDVIVQMVEGQEPVLKHYKLSSDTPTRMPMDHARMFLRDKAFVVADSAGNAIRPVLVADRTNPRITLTENQIIVEYEELSRAALMNRAKLLPGSDALGKASTNEQLIAFLKAANAAQPGVSRGSEGVIGEDPDISEIIPDSALIQKAA